MPNPYERRSQNEGAPSRPPQRKLGLETPLAGRFWGENKRLSFAPPSWYQTLVALCLIGGLWVGLAGYLGWAWFPLFQIGFWLGPALFLAGVWALLSMEYAVFDLRSRTFFRREGTGLFKRTRRGSMVDLDAVVVYCENYPYVVMGRVVIYRTVVHWKSAVVPLLVTEREQAALPAGAPMNYASGPIVARAQRYAQALGVAFHDNTYFHTPPPQSAV